MLDQINIKRILLDELLPCISKISNHASRKCIAVEEVFEIIDINEIIEFLSHFYPSHIIEILTQELPAKTKRFKIKSILHIMIAKYYILENIHTTWEIKLRIKYYLDKKLKSF